jgi:hypothetical protein
MVLFGFFVRREKPWIDLTMEEKEVSMGKTLEHSGHEPSLNWCKIL